MGRGSGKVSHSLWYLCLILIFISLCSLTTMVFRLIMSSPAQVETISVCREPRRKICPISDSHRKNPALADVSILIRAYWKQSPFLPYLFKSFAKYWPRPFPDITITFPALDTKPIEHHLKKTLDNPNIPQELKDKIRLYPVDDLLWTTTQMQQMQEPAKMGTPFSASQAGYWDQQLWKMHADEILVDAPYIMHVDCDCMFVREPLQSDIFDNATNLVRLYISKYSDLPPDVPWKRDTERLLGLEGKVEYEYMRRFPLTYPREAYLYLRARVLEAHGMSIDQIMVQQMILQQMGKVSPIALSEFNLLGACVHHFHPSLMYLKEFGHGDPSSPIRQYPSSDFIAKPDDPLAPFASQDDANLCNTLNEPPGCVDW